MSQPLSGADRVEVQTVKRARARARINGEMVVETCADRIASCPNEEEVMVDVGRDAVPLSVVTPGRPCPNGRFTLTAGSTLARSQASQQLNK